MVFTNQLASDEELQRLLDRQRAAVLVNIILAGSQAGVVRIDVVKGIELLVQHLLAAGRRRIALVTFPKNNYSATQRLLGYKQAMTKFGMPIDDDLIIFCDDSQAAVFEKVQDVLTNGPEIDALICYNDLMAATVLRACFDLGVAIPDRVAVTGFDNIPFSDLFKCPLTTVSVPWFEMGVTAAEMMLRRISGELATSEIVFTPELVVRESAP
jgi:LacI family transcriptional regulator